MQLSWSLSKNKSCRLNGNTMEHSFVSNCRELYKTIKAASNNKLFFYLIQKRANLLRDWEKKIQFFFDIIADKISFWSPYIVYAKS